MSSYSRLSSKYQNDSLSAPVFHFMRKERKTKTKKIQRKLKVKYRHILFSFLFVLGFFLILQKICVFLYSWEKLDVKLVEISCKNDKIFTEVQDWFESKHLGNLLLLNIDEIKSNLIQFTWIKDVNIRKSFPSTLKIQIKERFPQAVIKMENYYLIDLDGIRLKQILPEDNPGLPVFIDSHNFNVLGEEKMKLGWQCLFSLSREDQQSVEYIDLSKYENISLKFKDSSTWLILGNKDFRQKIESYQKYKPFLRKYGPLEYANLSIDDRIIIKPVSSSNNRYASDLSPNKEAM